MVKEALCWTSPSSSPSPSLSPSSSLQPQPPALAPAHGIALCPRLVMGSQHDHPGGVASYPQVSTLSCVLSCPATSRSGVRPGPGRMRLRMHPRAAPHITFTRWEAPGRPCHRPPAASELGSHSSLLRVLEYFPIPESTSAVHRLTQ